MKKSMILFSMLAIFSLAACTDSDKKSESTDGKSETTSSPASSSEQKDGTTIKVNNDGVSVESKDGDKKSNVSISTDSANIEISRPK